MKHLTITLLTLLMSMGAWAGYDIGLSCTTKESKKDDSFVDRKILIDKELKKVRSFYIETYKSKLGKPWDEIYDLRVSAEKYSWDTLDWDSYTGPRYDSSGDYAREFLLWVGRSNFMTFRLNRETLELEMDSNLGRDSTMPCKLSNVETVEEEIDLIYQEKNRIKNKERLEEEKQAKEQLKKNKI